MLASARPETVDRNARRDGARWERARAATVARARTGGWLDRRSDRAFALLLFAPGLILVGLFVLPPILAVFGMSLFRIELARDDVWRFVGLNNFALRLPAGPRGPGRDPPDGALRHADDRPDAARWHWSRRSCSSAAFRGRHIGRDCAAAAVGGGAGGHRRVLAVHLHEPVRTRERAARASAGGQPTNWLEDSTTAIVIAMIATAWRSVPLLALLILAALQAIPDALYRAARMDGASALAVVPVRDPAGHPEHAADRRDPPGDRRPPGVRRAVHADRRRPGPPDLRVAFAIVENAFTGLSFGYAAALSVRAVRADRAAERSAW